MSTTLSPLSPLPHLRRPWVERRAGHPAPTQLHFARRGVITEEMEHAARRERVEPEIVREEVGTLEQVNVAPRARGELGAGKLLPYALIGVIDVHCLFDDDLLGRAREEVA